MKVLNIKIKLKVKVKYLYNYKLIHDICSHDADNYSKIKRNINKTLPCMFNWNYGL